MDIGNTNTREGEEKVHPPKSQTCSQYLPTKHRFCKFPATAPQGFCVAHTVSPITTSHGDSEVTPLVRTPCPLDPSHSIYRSHLIRHMKVCTTTRDCAWELCQPFCHESVNDPKRTKPENDDNQDNDIGNHVTDDGLIKGSRTECDSKRNDQDLVVIGEGEEAEETAFLHAMSNSDQAHDGVQAFKEKSEHALRLGLSLKDYIEQQRALLAKCQTTKWLNKLARVKSGKTGLSSLLHQGRLAELHHRVDSMYVTCCEFLAVKPEYFLEGIVTDSTSSNEEKKRERGEGSEKLNQTFEPVPIGVDGAASLLHSADPPCVGVSCSGAPNSPNSPNSLNLSCHKRRKTEESDNHDVLPRDFTQLDSLLPFTYSWGHVRVEQEFFREVVRSGVKEATKKRETECSGLSFSSTPPSDETNGAPPMNKHEYQNASLLALCLCLGYFDPSTAIPTVTIELGAGRGALTRWFVLAATIADKLFQRASKSSAVKFVLIDKETRRNKAEGKNEAMFLDREISNTSILRLRLDIRDFDFYLFLRHLFGHHSDVYNDNGLSQPPRLLQFLQLFGVNLCPSRRNLQQGENCRYSEDSTGDNTNDNTELIRNQLLRLAKGGGPPIDNVIRHVQEHFTSTWIENQNVMSSNATSSDKVHLNILLTAKHLCGSATDASLRAVQNGIEQLEQHKNSSSISASSPSNGFIAKELELLCSFAVAPCCHHRCLWDEAVGHDFLVQLGVTSEDFAALVSASGIYWLRQHGFEDASLIRFVVGKPVTLENVVIVGKQTVKSQLILQQPS